MTDRLKGCTVTFTTDIREDDAQPIMDAISMLSGVLSVTGVVADLDDHMNRQKILLDISERLHQFAREILK